MSDSTTDLEPFADDVRRRVAACDRLEQVEALKVELFGKKGAVTALLKSLGALAPEARREAAERVVANAEAIRR